MKILGMASAGIVVIVAIAITITSFGNFDQINQDKIRVAFFPSIGHIIPIVGLEEKIFEKELGEEKQIETKLFDSGP